MARNSGANPNYHLTIEPDGNLPPQITVTQPLAGDILVEKAWKTVQVRWLSSDPEGDPKIVSLFIDQVGTISGNNIPIDGYQSLSGSDLQANVNTTQIGIGTWYIVARAWDLGAFGWSVSPGTFTIYIKGDISGNGVLDPLDYRIANNALISRGTTPRTKKILDMDRDGDFDTIDLEILHREIWP